MPSSTRIPNSVSCEAMPSPRIHGMSLDYCWWSKELTATNRLMPHPNQGSRLKAQSEVAIAFRRSHTSFSDPTPPAARSELVKIDQFKADQEGDRGDQAGEYAAGSPRQEGAEDQHKREAQVDRARVGEVDGQGGRQRVQLQQDPSPSGLCTVAGQNDGDDQADDQHYAIGDRLIEHAIRAARPAWCVHDVPRPHQTR